MAARPPCSACVLAERLYRRTTPVAVFACPWGEVRRLCLAEVLEWALQFGPAVYQTNYHARASAWLRALLSFSSLFLSKLSFTPY